LGFREIKMAKPVDSTIVKLIIAAGKANPAPPIGSVLGAKGVKIMEFCKSFNEQTKSIAETAKDKSIPLPTVITIYKDKTFKFTVKTPLASYLLLEAANVKIGSNMPNKNKIGKITSQQLRKIAEEKLVDLNTVSLEAAMRTVAGTARSMGIEIEEKS
jgi:large subunit ribosomal protein L11